MAICQRYGRPTTRSECVRADKNVSPVSTIEGIVGKCLQLVVHVLPWLPCIRQLYLSIQDIITYYQQYKEQTLSKRENVRVFHSRHKRLHYLLAVMYYSIINKLVIIVITSLYDTNCVILRRTSNKSPLFPCV